MIRINIEVDTVGQARLALRELLGEELTISGEPAVVPAPKATRGRKPSASTEGNASAGSADATLSANGSGSEATGSAESVSNEGNAAAGAAETTATGAGASQPATGDMSALRDEVRTKGVKYGQPHNGGQGALKELITQFGSATGKFSGIPDEQLSALNIRLDELLVYAK